MVNRAKNYIWAFLVLFCIIAILIYASIEVSKRKVEKEGVVLYFSNTCEHCEITRNFIKENNILAKITLTEKEVDKNTDNSSELLSRITKCGITTDKVGLPVVWDKGKCIMGDEDTINYLKEKTK